MTPSWLSRHRYKLLPALLFAALALSLVIFYGQLRHWFLGAENTSSKPVVKTSEVSDAGVASQSGKFFDENALAALRSALEAYEEVRLRLAQDSLEELLPRGTRISQSLRAAAQTVSDMKLKASLEQGAVAAEELGKADLEQARRAFSEVSRALVTALSVDARLAKGFHVYQCPMVEGYRKWLQANEELMNPYMGPRMLKCGGPSEWEQVSVAERGHTASASNEIAHYTCPMHPSIKQPTPGKCPICGMDLSPVTQAEVQTGVIFIDAERRQLIGVKTTRVAKRNVEKTIRTVGKITYDEERLADVSLKYKGWIEKLYADTTGQRVRKGQPLFTVYSPEIYAAQQDLLIASGRTRGVTYSTKEALEATSTLLDSAKQRLRLWDVPESVINQVLEKGEAVRAVPVTSPASGFIIEKNVVAGSAVDAGQRLFRIANLDKVWIEADLYESELSLVSVGAQATVTLPYVPGTKLSGKVSFVYPYLSSETRTGQVRIELENSRVELKPDMFATVELVLPRGERLVIPESAVIYAGPRRVVFLDLGEGKLRPQTIEIGLKSNDSYEVLSGLKEGDIVVSSGNFLVAAESRLKAAEGAF